jgi:divalent metal cation (Fe/Co/Zn/Cd) transporter
MRSNAMSGRPKPVLVPEPALTQLRHRGLWLLGIGMTWTLGVAAVAVAAGVAASSIALLGLGLESVIELLAAAIVIWQLSGGAARERRAMRLIGATFLASAVYLMVESIRELAEQDHSGHSTVGLGVAAAALLIMPLLGYAKRRTGRALDSRTLLADADETTGAAAAAAAALAGVGLDTWLGWWWTVPAAGLIIAAFAVWEGILSWRSSQS